MKLVSTQTELTVLRNLCSKDLAISGTLLSGVDDSYFHNEFVQEAYTRIRTQTKKTGEIPTWRELLEDPGLSEKVRIKLKDTDVEKLRTPKEAVNAVSLLNKYRQLRGLYNLSEFSVEQLRKKKVDPSELLDQIAERVVKLRQSRSAGNDALVFGKGNNSTQFIKQMMEAEEHDFIPTGLKAFDEENNGFGFGNLVLLAGTTGAGKSQLAGQLGINWSNMGEDVTFVPLEMSKKEMSARIMANASGIDVQKILFGKMSENEKLKYWKAYKRFVVSRKKQQGTLRIFKPSSDMTIEEIMASIYPYGSRIVIIDYISLLKGVDGDDAWQKLGAVARYCKIYAETNNMIVVLLAQLSDEGLVRYARSLLEHANYAWTFIATSATREQEILNIEQKKARNGRLYSFTLKSLMSCSQIRDLQDDEKTEIEDAAQRRHTTDGKGGAKNKFKKGKLGRHTPEDDSPAKSKPSKDYLRDLSDEDDDDE